jgi:hypothetical protein
MNCFSYTTNKPYDCPKNECKMEHTFCSGLIESLLNENFKKN